MTKEILSLSDKKTRREEQEFPGEREKAPPSSPEEVERAFLEKLSPEAAGLGYLVQQKRIKEGRTEEVEKGFAELQEMAREDIDAGREWLIENLEALQGFDDVSRFLTLVQDSKNLLKRLEEIQEQYKLTADMSVRNTIKTLRERLEELEDAFKLRQARKQIAD